MIAELPTFRDVLAAAPHVYRRLRPTLLYRWPVLERRVGFPLHLKHENHQPTGAFKLRGGVNLVSHLTEDERQRGIIGCSTGNHGQSLAFAARAAGIACRIVVPNQANAGKVASMLALGAEVLPIGKDFDEAKIACEAMAADKGYRYVHSANEPLLIAGVGTMALEVVEELPEPDVMIVPIGLGSGICGTGLVLAAKSPRTKLIGVQAVGASAVADSWRSGKTVAYPALNTLAEGLATRAPAEMTLELMRKLVADIVLVSDAEMLSAMHEVLLATHNLPEPAGAAAVAAAYKLRNTLVGKSVVAVFSGGNVDLKQLPAAIEAPRW